MPIVSIRQLHFPIELSESDFSLFHLVNQVFQIISKDDILTLKLGHFQNVTIQAKTPNQRFQYFLLLLKTTASFLRLFFRYFLIVLKIIMM